MFCREKVSFAVADMGHRTFLWTMGNVLEKNNISSVGDIEPGTLTSSGLDRRS